MGDGVGAMVVKGWLYPLDRQEKLIDGVFVVAFRVLYVFALAGQCLFAFLGVDVDDCHLLLAYVVH